MQSNINSTANKNQGKKTKAFIAKNWNEFIILSTMYQSKDVFEYAFKNLTNINSKINKLFYIWNICYKTRINFIE